MCFREGSPDLMTQSFSFLNCRRIDPSSLFLSLAFLPAAHVRS